MSLHVEDMNKKGIKSTSKEPENCSMEKLQKLFGQSDYDPKKEETSSTKYSDKEFEMLNKNDYIKWLTKFITENNIADNNLSMKSRLVSDEDKEQIRKLDVLYNVVRKYAVRHNIGTAKEHIYIVRFNNVCFGLGKVPTSCYAMKSFFDQAEINFEDIIDEAIHEALEEKNDDPVFLANVTEALADIDEEIAKDIENSVRKEDNIDEIARLILYADSEERDKIILTRFPELLKEYNRVLQKCNKVVIESDEAVKIKTEPYYVTWLASYLDEHKIINETPVKRNNEDKQNIEKLGIFYDGIKEYAKKHGIGDSCVDKYIVGYQGSYFMVSKEDGFIRAGESYVRLAEIDYDKVMEYFRTQVRLKGDITRAIHELKTEPSIHDIIYQKDVPFIPTAETVGKEVKKYEQVLKDPLYLNTLGEGNKE